MRIAVAHDWLCGYRGGEGVLDQILALVLAEHQLAGLYVMFDDGGHVTDRIDAIPRTASIVGRLPLASGPLRRWLLPCYPLAVRDLSRRLARHHARQPIDLLISTSSAAIKGLRPPPGVPHLCYIHSPARYVWSQSSAYAKGNPLRAIGLAACRAPFARWDRASCSRVTEFLANSSYVASEVRRCYGRDARVLHPPVRTDFFTPADTPREPSWLVVAAMEPYKRVDLAIDAANARGVKLRVIGAGSELARLRARAGPTVEFLGRVGDEHLRHVYRTASVLIFPQIEDFGIVAVEAQACGLPVAARAAGGALDSVIDAVTGAFFSEPTPAALAAAADRAAAISSAACVQHAQRFAPGRFDAGLREVIQRLTGARMSNRAPSVQPVVGRAPSAA